MSSLILHAKDRFAEEQQGICVRIYVGSNIEKMGKINVFLDFSEGFRNVLIFNVISGLNFLFSGFFTKKYIANNQNINNIRI